MAKRLDHTIALVLRVWARQRIFIVVSVLVYAIFWAIGQPGPIGINLIYSLCLGNLTLSFLDHVEFLYCRHGQFRWPAYIALLLAIAPVAVVFASTIAFWADTRPGGGHFQFHQPWDLFWRYQKTSWKFPFIAIMAVGIFVQLFVRAKARLESRNRELQRSVQSEITRRELQEQELERALEIQQGLLPKQIPQIAGFEIAGVWEPARIVGGDYFDVIRLSEDKLGICIADVVGKSVSAALLMANVQATVRAFASESAAPSWLCGRVNSVMCSNIASGKFVTLFYGILDGRCRTLQYANAGHLPPILVRACGNVERLENGGALLGVFPEWKYGDSVVHLVPGDHVVLFTDGITEAANSDAEEFGEERLLNTARSGGPDSATELNAALLKDVKNFCDSRLQDDATLITIAALPTVTEQRPEAPKVAAVSAM